MRSFSVGLRVKTGDTGVCGGSDDIVAVVGVAGVCSVCSSLNSLPVWLGSMDVCVFV